jgi:hypothetical protein
MMPKHPTKRKMSNSHMETINSDSTIDGSMKVSAVIICRMDRT